MESIIMKNKSFWGIALLAIFLGSISSLHARPSMWRNTSNHQGNWCGCGGMCGGNYGNDYYHNNQYNNYNRSQSNNRFMSQAEEMAYQDQMFASKNYNDCRKIQDQQYTKVVSNAKANGINLPKNPPKIGLCEELSDNGYF